MIALIDADILTYQIGFGAEDDEQSHAITSLDGFICDLMLFDLPDVFDYEFYITGKSKQQPNYREALAVTQPYKGNRKGTNKPKHLEALRNRLVDYWEAEVAYGEEADDLISKRMTELGDDCICVSIDKDLDTVPGWHYNFRKEERYYVDQDEALYNFYTQLLTGDRVDNIRGVDNIGPKKAAKILDNCGHTELEMWEACVEAHGSYERALEDARLLHMRRKDNELWHPPS
jgi:hypothetical protein